MFSLLELALNNNIIYISIIVVLIIIIILTILSIKKDRDAAIKARSYVKPEVTEEEKVRARLELEKVVDEMQKNLDKEEIPKEITTYEQEQESKAIISYQELVEAVRNNKENMSEAHNEVGMEVADKSSIEEPATNEVDDTKKYQTGEFISPIYGASAEPSNEEVDPDIEEVDEFLDSLKDFRKNL